MNKITNLDDLQKLTDINTVDKIVLEYLMTKKVEADKFNQIVDVINNDGTIEDVKTVIDGTMEE